MTEPFINRVELFWFAHEWKCYITARNKWVYTGTGQTALDALLLAFVRMVGKEGQNEKISAANLARHLEAKGNSAVNSSKRVQKKARVIGPCVQEDFAGPEKKG